MDNQSLAQGSPEWLEMRKSRVGASDVPVILGISPYKTALQLWREKTGRCETPPSNPAMRMGNRMEPVVRDKYESDTGLVFMPKVVFHKVYNGLMASLDGITFCGTKILEIKCCNREVFVDAQRGVVVPHYYAQIQFQLACCETATECHYVCYNKCELATVIVKRDEEYISKITDKALMFYHCLMTGEAPGATEKDSIEITDEAFLDAAQEYRYAKARLDVAKIDEEIAKTKLLDLTDDGNCHGGGVTIKRHKRISVSYKQAALDAGVDLDKYKKESVGYWKITIKEES